MCQSEISLIEGYTDREQTAEDEKTEGETEVNVSVRTERVCFAQIPCAA